MKTPSLQAQGACSNHISTFATSKMLRDLGYHVSHRLAPGVAEMQVPDGESAEYYRGMLGGLMLAQCWLGEGSALGGQLAEIAEAVAEKISSSP